MKPRWMPHTTGRWRCSMGRNGQARRLISSSPGATGSGANPASARRATTASIRSGALAAGGAATPFEITDAASRPQRSPAARHAAGASGSAATWSASTPARTRYGSSGSGTRSKRRPGRPRPLGAAETRTRPATSRRRICSRTELGAGPPLGPGRPRRAAPPPPAGSDQARGWGPRGHVANHRRACLAFCTVYTVHFESQPEMAHGTELP